ncbi:serine/threonine-protein kinase [Pseudonocardia sp. GCM10023141]|uniref:serine/threonine-protein kinase n=1 Tax=Pseudonocardia sp. GCM10023141 TaxID=3252653 RepID=UPI003609354C
MEPLASGDPRTIGRFTLRGVLGTGGMGRVYLAEDPASSGQVAVKVIRSELAEDADFRARFHREVAAATLVPGAFTAAVVDSDTAAASPWIATRYVPGPSLTERVDEHGPLPAGELRVLARGLLQALAAVHAAGLVHRDLKPSNVLLAADRPRIIDFGIARAADATRLTTTGSVIGTPAYMAPEQALGRSDLGPACDVFALGSVLVFAATGRSPYDAPLTPAILFRILHQDPDLGDTPEPVRALVRRCLVRDPAARPDATTLLGATRPGWQRRFPLLAGAAAVVAAAVAAGVLLLPQAAAPGPVPPSPVATAPAGDPDFPAITVGPTFALGFRTGPVTASAERVYVGDVDTGAIAAFDTAGAPAGRVDVGRFPTALALSPTRLFVALNSAPTRIVAVDPTTLQVTGGMDLPAGTTNVRAIALALSPDATTLYVLDPPSSSVLAIDAATLTVRATWTYGAADAMAMAAGPDGRVYVALGDFTATGTVTVLDASTLTRITTFPGAAAPADLATSPDGRTLYLADVNPSPEPDAGGVWVLDTATGRRTARLTAPPTPAAVLAGARWLYATDPVEHVITAYAIGTGTASRTATLSDTIDDIAIAPDGRTLYAVGGSTLTLLRP